jgi:hypothetical protein
LGDRINNGYASGVAKTRTGVKMLLELNRVVGPETAISAAGR